MSAPFPKLLGNSESSKRLSALIRSSSLPHALMIVGPEGSGKHTMAMEIAAALNCERPDSSTDSIPCGVCSCCRRIYSGSFPDVVFLKKEQSRATIGVEELRNFKEDVFLSPTEADGKCYVIEDADLMTPAAQNALLKIFEEPPRAVHIILLVREADKILTTIKSRAQSISTEIFSPEKTESYVLSISSAARTLNATAPDKLRGIILASGGVIGKALSLLNDGEAKTEAVRDIVLKLLSAFPKRTPFAVLWSSVNALPQKKDELRSVLESAVCALRDMLILLTSDLFTPTFFVSREECERFTANLTEERIVAIYDVINSALTDIEKNVLIAPLLTDIALKVREA